VIQDKRRKYGKTTNVVEISSSAFCAVAGSRGVPGGLAVPFLLVTSISVGSEKTERERERIDRLAEMYKDDVVVY